MKQSLEWLFRRIDDFPQLTDPIHVRVRISSSQVNDNFHHLKVESKFHFNEQLTIKRVIVS